VGVSMSEAGRDDDIRMNEVHGDMKRFRNRWVGLDLVIVEWIHI
jgi:hypothetical protein